MTRIACMRRFVAIGVCLWLTAVWAAAAHAQARGGGVTVYLEDSPAVGEWIDQARQLRELDRLGEAAAVYQKVIDQHPRKLVQVSTGIYTDAARWVQAALLADADLLAAYRRLYEDPAQALLAEASTPTVDPPGLQGVLERYWVCPTALEAGLMLAGYYLERADADRAGLILDDLQGHPDLSAHMVRWHALQAAAGLFGDDPERYGRHIQAVQDTDGTGWWGDLKTWAKRINRPAAVPVVSGLGVLPAVETPDPLGAPLWEKTTSETVSRQKIRAMVGGRLQLRGQIQVIRPGVGLEHYPVIPVAQGQWLYMINSDTLQAVDRNSGQEVWRYTLASFSGDNARDAGLIRNLTLGAMSQPELRSPVAVGDRIAAVLGVSRPFRVGMKHDALSTHLTMVDRETGGFLWAVSAGDLDPSLATASFYGTPQAVFGQLYVLARRSQRSGFNDAYLLAVDSVTGRLLWRRHLFSVTGVQASGQRGAAGLTTHGGRLFVSDSLGNVACVNGHDGSMVWLTVLSDLPDVEVTSPIGPRSQQAVRWQPSRAIHTPAGLIVGIQGQPPGVVVIDPETGRLVRRLEGVKLSGNVYLAPAETGVLVVGRIMQLLDGQTLERLWISSLGVTKDDQPSGVAAVTQDRIFVPTRGGLFVLDHADGKVLRKHATDEPGNVLALPGQIVIAGSSSVRSYLSWEHAYEHLSRQLATRRDDPRPGLVLAHVALAVKQDTVVLEGVDHAIAALGRRISGAGSGGSPDTASDIEALQKEVFDQVLDLAQSPREPSAGLRRVLFNRLATVTTGPADEVAYHLTIGAFQAQAGELEDAVEHYQAILDELTLSLQMYQHGAVRRQAGIEAKARLAAVIAEHGDWTYARYESEAAGRFLELTSSPTPDVDGLLELSRRYGLSRSAPVAMLAAAQGLASRGDRAAAIGQLRRAYRKTTEPALLQRIVGLLAELYEQAGRPGRAGQWLAQVRRVHPDLVPLRQGRPVPIRQWIAQLVDRPEARDQLPLITLPLAKPHVLHELLLLPTGQEPALWARDRFVTTRGSTVRMRRGDALGVLWEASLPAGGVELLSIRDDQVLLWRHRAGVLVALDAATGRESWSLQDVRSLLGHAESDPAATSLLGRGLQGQPRHMEQIEKRIAANDVGESGSLLVAVNEMVVCVADRQGRVVGVDRRSGRLLWRVAGSQNPLKLTAIDDDVVALAGRMDPLSGGEGWGLRVLDAVSGEPLFGTIFEKDEVRWLGLTGEGLLIYATSRQAVAHELRTGRAEWGLSVADSRIAAGWIGHDLLLLQVDALNGSLMAIEPTTGHVANHLANLFPDMVQPKRLSLRRADGGWNLLTRHEAASIGADGRVRWRDAIDRETGGRQVLQLIGAEVVAVLYDDPPAGKTPMYTLYLLNRESGAILGGYPLGPLPGPINPDRAVFLDDRLIFSTGSTTLVIPGSGGAVH